MSCLFKKVLPTFFDDFKAFREYNYSLPPSFCNFWTSSNIPSPYLLYFSVNWYYKKQKTCFWSKIFEAIKMQDHKIKLASFAVNLSFVLLFFFCVFRSLVITCLCFQQMGFIFHTFFWSLIVEDRYYDNAFFSPLNPSSSSAFKILLSNT